MLTIAFTLFIAGLLTILLPCILPLLPIVLGVSITDRHPLRPIATVGGMILSFVGFTFLLQVVLSQFVELADGIRIGTYYVILLFGFGFLTSSRPLLWIGAILGSFFFIEKGWLTVAIAAVIGIIAMEIGGKVAAKIQQLGADIQQQARESVGQSHQLLSAFFVGMTLGLVWAPCAGPALSFALTVVRDRPGSQALLLLFAYALGAGVPLLIIGYGGQWAAKSVRSLARYTYRIKQVAGVLLILSAITFHVGWFTDLQIWLADNTSIGSFGTRLEEQLFQDDSPSIGGIGIPSEQPQVRIPAPDVESSSSVSSVPSVASVSSSHRMTPVPSDLPKIVRAPEFSGLGPWHNSESFTLASLKGKVVLVDFWTYSCINCIRTLPHIEGYWQKYKNQPFVLIGIHSPEFVFEKSEANVAQAIKEHGLTYPTAQDNDFATWKAFSNRYWPAKYLIDAEGYIRYFHFGEGSYDETDAAIMSLLMEIGSPPPGATKTIDTSERVSAPAGQQRDISPETYLGERSWPALGNAQGDPSSKVVSYQAPATMDLHKYYLVGDWKLVDGEHQELVSDQGEIRMKFLGGEINLVLGAANASKPVIIDVIVDRKMVKTITVDHHDLYGLFKGQYGEHEIILRMRGKGLEGYAFTFGG